MRHLLNNLKKALLFVFAVSFISFELTGTALAAVALTEANSRVEADEVLNYKGFYDMLSDRMTSLRNAPTACLLVNDPDRITIRIQGATETFEENGNCIVNTVEYDKIDDLQHPAKIRQTVYATGECYITVWYLRQLPEQDTVDSMQAS